MTKDFIMYALDSFHSSQLGSVPFRSKDSDADLVPGGSLERICHTKQNLILMHVINCTFGYRLFFVSISNAEKR